MGEILTFPKQDAPKTDFRAGKKYLAREYKKALEAVDGFFELSEQALKHRDVKTAGDYLKFALKLNSREKRHKERLEKLISKFPDNMESVKTLFDLKGHFPNERAISNKSENLQNKMVHAKK